MLSFYIKFWTDIKTDRQMDNGKTIYIRCKGIKINHLSKQSQVFKVLKKPVAITKDDEDFHKTLSRNCVLGLNLEMVFKVSSHEALNFYPCEPKTRGNFHGPRKRLMQNFPFSQCFLFY